MKTEFKTDTKNFNQTSFSNDPKVYTIIPVFNRVHHTLSCINYLKMQNHKNHTIVIVDGLSTDKTPEKVENKHPDVVVLKTKVELWWGQAMQKGMQWVLDQNPSDDGYILMMNNDTQFDEDFINLLIKDSKKYDAAVGSLGKCINDDSIIVDAGDFIDWPSYAYRSVHTIYPNKDVYEKVNVLPGRGSLVPLKYIIKFGVVNGERYPHYLSDYEYFYRLHINGVKLIVSYSAIIKSYREITGMTQDPGRGLFYRLKVITSKKSPSNFITHWKFINEWAPKEIKFRILVGSIAGTFWYIVNESERIKKIIFTPLFVIKRSLQFILFFISPPLAFSDSELNKIGIDKEEIISLKIIMPTSYKRFLILKLKYNFFHAKYKSTSNIVEKIKSISHQVPRSYKAFKEIYLYETTNFYNHNN